MQIGRSATVVLAAGVLAAGGWGAAAFAHAGARAEGQPQPPQAPPSPRHPIPTAHLASIVKRPTPTPQDRQGCPSGFTHRYVTSSRDVLWVCASSLPTTATVTVTHTANPCTNTTTTGGTPTGGTTPTTPTTATTTTTPIGNATVTATVIVMSGGPCTGN